MVNANQEIHLWPAALTPAPPPTAQPPPVRLPFAPAMLSRTTDAFALAPTPADQAAAPGVFVEPFVNARKQLRLLARFPEASIPQVNGEPAPRWIVLAPGDFFHWAPGFGFCVALFSKPQIGPPPASVLGRPCPVCRVPFADTTTTVTCLCGVVLHCEVDKAQGLQCAQIRRECPICKRAVVLTEGYVNAPSHED